MPGSGTPRSRSNLTLASRVILPLACAPARSVTLARARVIDAAVLVAKVVDLLAGLAAPRVQDLARAGHGTSLVPR